MPKFIILNGDKASVIERKGIKEARQTAINLCDHSEEVLVRPLADITDYTRVYQNIPVDAGDIFDDPEIENELRAWDVQFQLSGETSYGFIGNLIRNDKSVVDIYTSTFYVNNPTFPINPTTFKLIKSLQYWNRKL